MKNIYRLSLTVILIFLSGHLFAQQRSISSRVDSLLKLMTIEEKAGQLNQYSGRELTGPASTGKSNMLDDIRNGKVGSVLNVKGVKETREVQSAALQSRLKIPLLFSLDVIHGYKTVFPVPLGEAASWDLNAIEISARVAAEEASAAGLHWTFAPMVDIARDPRWGRVMEGAGEDTYLGSLIAAARVRGFQGKKLGGVSSLMACAKHFAAYGAAIAGRDYNAVDMSEQQLWESYLPPFAAAVNAGVATFMNSFNTFNGTPATASTYLQRDILKGKWKYNGFVVSDWGSIREMLPWGYAKDLADAAEYAIKAGSDMDMESRAYLAHLPHLIKSGKIKMAIVDDAVRRILYKKFELGLFDDPYRFSSFERESKVLNDTAYRMIARDVAQKSIVLLKNKNKTLPLAKTGIQYAVIGPLANAKRDLEGGWIVKSDSQNVVSLLEGIHAKIADKSNVVFSVGCAVKDTATNGFAEAMTVANKSDVIILVVGETWDMTGEAKSRTSIDLPGRQEDLFNALKTTGKPIVVVIMSGRPLIFNSIADTADAILYAWFPGSEGGNAIANVLFGDYNPSGKLPITFPRNIGQVPIFYNYYNTGRPVLSEKNIVYKSAYIDAPNTPKYAFGYGLSYTTFTYSDLQLSNTRLNKSGSINVKFKLTNTGSLAGEEVIQLYIRDLVASPVRPVKELKDFSKVMLKAGESKTISFTINKDKLSFYNNKLDWITEPGEFDIMIGSVSNDIRLSNKITLY